MRADVEKNNNGREISAQEIEEISSILEQRSALEQVKALSDSHPSYASLAILFADSDYGQYDVACRTKRGNLRATGGYADVYDGKMLFAQTDSALDSIRQEKDRKQALQDQRYGPFVLKKVALKRFRVFLDPNIDFAKVLAKFSPVNVS